MHGSDRGFNTACLVVGTMIEGNEGVVGGRAGRFRCCGIDWEHVVRRAG